MKYTFLPKAMWAIFRVTFERELYRMSDAERQRQTRPGKKAGAHLEALCGQTFRKNSKTGTPVHCGVPVVLFLICSSVLQGRFCQITDTAIFTSCRLRL